jgi:hypothetical protein
MELHRLAIAVVALLLAFSVAFAAGRIASGEHRATRLPESAATQRDGDEPVLRLGKGTRARSSSAPIGTPHPPLATLPPLVEQPAPSVTATAPPRQVDGARESNAPPIVSAGGGE